MTDGLEDFIRGQKWHAREARPCPPTEQKVSFAPRNEFVTFYGNPKSRYDHVTEQARVRCPLRSRSDSYNFLSVSGGQIRPCRKTSVGFTSRTPQSTYHIRFLSSPPPKAFAYPPNADPRHAEHISGFAVKVRNCCPNFTYIQY